MQGVIVERGFICCFSNVHRFRLEDGRHVFMLWHNVIGPAFFLDQACNREIINWFEDKQICDALNWFCQRGHTS